MSYINYNNRVHSILTFVLSTYLFIILLTFGDGKRRNLAIARIYNIHMEQSMTNFTRTDLHVSFFFSLYNDNKL